jgi:hypothetical protein
MLDAMIALFAVTIVMPIVVSALVFFGRQGSHSEENGKSPAVYRRAS